LRQRIPCGISLTLDPWHERGVKGFVCAAPDPDVITGAALPTDQRSAGRTILVVDDDPDVRDYAVSVLQELGFRVIAAGDGEAALAILQQDPSIGLLFTDVVMPRLNGFELAERARQADPSLKILFASGYATDLTPAARLLKKPYRPQQLRHEVTALLRAC
jgi:CheY-like chemotaxis protein